MSTRKCARDKGNGQSPSGHCMLRPGGYFYKLLTVHRYVFITFDVRSCCLPPSFALELSRIDLPGLYCPGGMLEAL